LEEGKRLRAAGRSWRDIGRELGLDEGTLRKRMKKELATAPDPELPL
jgi:DNA-binding Lrp family transcriptional regulator